MKNKMKNNKRNNSTTHILDTTTTATLLLQQQQQLYNSNKKRNDLENELCIAEMWIEGKANVLDNDDHPQSKEHLAKYIAVRKSMTDAKLKVISKITQSLLESVVNDYLEVHHRCEANELEEPQLPLKYRNLFHYRLMKKLGAATGSYMLLMDNLTEKMQKYDWVCKSYRAKHTKKIQVLYFNPDKNDVIKKHLSWYENPKNPQYSGLSVEEKMIKIFGPKAKQNVNYEFVPKGKLFALVDGRDNRFNEVLFKTLVRPELREKMRSHPDFITRFTGRCIMLRDEVDNPITDLYWLRDVFAYDDYYSSINNLIQECKRSKNIPRIQIP